MSNGQNNAENITTTFQNGNGGEPAKTSSYVVKEADVTGTRYTEIPPQERMAFPLSAIDVVGQRLLLEKGSPIKINKGDLYKVYSPVTRVTSAFVLGTDNEIQFFTDKNPGVLIAAINKSEQTPAATLEHGA